MSDLAKVIENIRQPWVGSPYYSDAEQWTFLFWDPKHPFRRMFDLLPGGTVIDLACGHGRHAEMAAPHADRLILVDVIEENLAVCRDRLRDVPNVEFRLGGGVDFPDTADGSIDAIYCYDAMVHFAPEIVDSYLRQTYRVLRSGGRALFHHSNYAQGKGKVWNQNPHARNYMTRELFAESARRHGLDVIEQNVIPWGDVAELDCISLVGRP